MPIPEPTDDEEREKFMDRCMGDSNMGMEFKDMKQRAAVCMSKWESHNKKRGKKKESPKEKDTKKK